MDQERLSYGIERLMDEGCSAESAKHIAQEIADTESEVAKLRNYILSEFKAYNKGELETFWEENPL